LPARRAKRNPAPAPIIGAAARLRWQSGFLTGRLVRAFFPKPSEHLPIQIKAFEAAKPLPLWQAKLLCLFGGM
jgi:hypothetical protein